MPGLNWGSFEQFFTPAFWRAQVWFDDMEAQAKGDPRNAQSFCIGRSLREEVAACLLGGHGIPAEVGLAAFFRIRDAGLIERETPSILQIQHALNSPLEVDGRRVRYRFAAQKSAYLAAAFRKLSESDPPVHDGRSLRDWLLQLAGVGLKTASWITRNFLGSNAVAIIDIHIHRAGLIMGLFARNQIVQRDYLAMENRFLAFSDGIGVSAASLDAAVWREMRLAGPSIRLAMADKASDNIGPS